MRLVLSQDQETLHRTALKFVEEHSPVSRVRKLRDDKDDVGFSWELYQTIAELGWIGLHLPEEHGGSALSFLDWCLVLEAAGRNLMPEPLLTSAIGLDILSACGRDCAPIIRGESLFALVHEGIRADGALLTGEAFQVSDAHVAHGLLVRTDDSVFLVDRKAVGLTIERQHRIDSRNVAIVRMHNVRGERIGGSDVADRAIDRATIGLAAEMLGAATKAFETTVKYLHQRQQFGVAIGTFQALQHRAARLYIELEFAKSALYAAAAIADEDASQLAKYASLAKVQCGNTFTHVAREAIQMHGGIGMTDDLDIGFYFKRARVADVTFHNAAWHMKRWAQVQGYAE